MPAKTAAWHSEPTQLHHHIGTGCKLSDTAFPLLEYFLAFPGVATYPQEATGMIHDDRRIRKRSRQVCQFTQLRIILPGIKTESILLETGKPFPELSLQHHSFTLTH